MRLPSYSANTSNATVSAYKSGKMRRQKRSTREPTILAVEHAAGADRCPQDRAFFDAISSSALAAAEQQPVGRPLYTPTARFHENARRVWAINAC